ncbi:hypothetical protein H9Q69_007815 [Fusarium xylarioides]|nr:hypothetical protein H9Q70_013147 [Fusarium xylarioides]KAG5793117.1 hypothetical protein H9Q69_007815 [Fusarium xylarioides]
MPDYLQAYLDFLGEEWLTRWSNSTHSNRRLARTAIELMANITITNPEIIELLATYHLYRWRTQVLFGVTWSTRDGDTYSPSVSINRIVVLEVGWATDRLKHFDLWGVDNTYIAEGQYINNCVGQTCFRVYTLTDWLYEKEEEEQEREWLCLVRFLQRARIIAQELVNLNSLLHVCCQLPSNPRVLPVSKFPRLLTFIAKVP